MLWPDFTENRFVKKNMGKKDCCGGGFGRLAETFRHKPANEISGVGKNTTKIYIKYYQNFANV
jgi:hypothetical protein